MKPCCHHLNEGHRLVAQLEEFVDEPAEHGNGADIILTHWAQQAAKWLKDWLLLVSMSGMLRVDTRVS